jgi:rare lipoprotein A
VTGALFRRERDNPGPTLQISSDAAEALGILAGQPTEIRVTALRKEEIAVPADPVAAETTAEDPATEGAEAQAPATPDAAAAETAALAAAALDVADGVTDGRWHGS